MIYWFFFVIWVITVVMIYNSYSLKNEPRLQQPKFEKKFYNELYTMSFGIPFKWFVDDDENPTHPKTKKLKAQLEMSGLDKYFTLRSYMTLKVLLLVVSLLAGGIVLLCMKYSYILSKILFNVETDPRPLTIQTTILVMCFFLLVALLPDILLKGRVKKKIKEHIKDIPVLQMFIILMLRSNKTIAEILYALSKINTPHRTAFEKGYRIYLRNQGEGLQFLKKHFKGTRFVETFNLLEDIGEYARSECIRILESNLASLVEEMNTIKRRTDMSHLIYSQASMFVPFVAILVLGAFPLIVMGIKIFMNSFGGGLM